MKRFVGLFLSALAFNGVAQQTVGDSYVCSNGFQERKIFVRYTNPPAQVPCQVVYQKDGETKPLWNAQYESGYCESKAATFVVQQETWGYSCVKQPPQQDQTQQ